MDIIICLLSLIAGFLMGKMTQPLRINIANNADFEEEQPLKIPSPAQIYRDKKEQKAEDKELKKLERIIENIENYDGTAASQKDI